MSTPPLLGRPVGARGDQTRQRLIDATLRCVAEVGYARATIRQIARTAGMTSGSLYHYFPNKGELVKETFREIAQQTVPRFTAAVAAADGVLDKLMAVLDEADQMVHDSPYAVPFDRAIRVESAADLNLAQNSDTIVASIHSVVTGILRDADEQHVLADGIDLQAATNVIGVLLMGLYEQALTAPTAEYHSTIQALKLMIQGKFWATPGHQTADGADLAPSSRARAQSPPL
ncbi:TetR/AcrR family transcriptional regulator [Pseudofrankia inefficax]|uniref:Transcriptional regulator, TetR family n=1 Tax=Pseudofrankia inefficax (strain DSM 45817 / CECT 9037 / DDB 130130 / EuI1c) TaxID=298654 RepID=E3J9N4_PSEI1|nr:TetR/AcrR family transcriptional regulator [Pseudofrankia inefficax]ADP84537.1 transcriptional regulator, TetR family [Pseudofrankia inefficax]